MKIVSLTVLHYGSEYLEYALRSVADYVDECWILYAHEGSHGSRTDVRCPDTRYDLRLAALRGAGAKVRWRDGNWANEGDQRNAIHEYAPDADVIVVVDADEIYPASRIGVNCFRDMSYMHCKRYQMPFVHFWRSFYRAVIDDSSLPTRIIVPNAPLDVTGVLEGDPVCHMGYAQRSELVEYKMLTHGHRHEWRPDWYATRFAVNAQSDCHPVNVNYWNPVAVNPQDYMPAFMNEHPYAKLEVIP